MAVEVYQGAYGPEADLWSLGVVTYECLVGIVPFHGDKFQGKEAIRLIRQRIVQHETLLVEKLARTRQRGYTCQISEDFISKMICDRSRRLNAVQCRRDPFFEGLDFSQLHELVPPIVPSVEHPSDIRYFEKFQLRELPEAETGARKDASMEWLCYDYDKEQSNLDRADVDVGSFFHAQPNPRHDQLASPSPNSNSLTIAPLLQTHGQRR